MVLCDEHGSAAAATVCAHILASLDAGPGCGFVWWIGEDDWYQATCTGCQTMPFEEWERTHFDLARVICIKCFERAAEVHGVSLAGGPN
jgi:hypothetical protein